MRHVRANCSRKKPGEESFRDSSTTDHDHAFDITLDHSFLSTPQTGNSSRLSTVTANGAARANIPWSQPVLEPHRPPNNTAERSLPDTFASAESNGSDSNILGAIGTAPVSLQESVNGAIQGPLDVPQPFDLSKIDMESGWASWLLCDDFNLDAVNCSLLQATGERGSLGYHASLTEQSSIEPETIVSQSTERGFAQQRDTIKRKWHTYCEPVSLGRPTPDATLENGRIDEVYRQELTERLQPRVQTGILPSTAFIVCYMMPFTQYWRQKLTRCASSGSIFVFAHTLDTFSPSSPSFTSRLSTHANATRFFFSPSAQSGAFFLALLERWTMVLVCSRGYRKRTYHRYSMSTSFLISNELTMAFSGKCSSQATRIRV